MYKNSMFWARGTEPIKNRGASCRERKMNERFLDLYLETDGLCALKFDVAIGGVTEYVDRLNSLRFIQGGDCVLPRLLRYRDLRNRFAHEAGALGKEVGVTREDLKWLKRFSKDLYKNRDPISAYLRRERRLIRRGRIWRTAFGAALGMIAILAVSLYLVLKTR